MDESEAEAVSAHGGFGFSPFGIDHTRYVDKPLGATRLTKKDLGLFAINYELLGPMDREIARLNLEGKLQAVAEQKGKPQQTLDFGPWKAIVSYGLRPRGPTKSPPGNPQPIGRALVAQLGSNEFLVSGFFFRIDFEVSEQASGKHRQYLKVEQGHYQNDVFHAERIWNGDETDWGLNFSSVPQVLQVAVETY